MEQLVEIASGNPHPDRTTEENEMRRLVREAINTLPDNERQSVSLFYISDYSQRDVAAFLGVSVRRREEPYAVCAETTQGKAIRYGDGQYA